MTQSIIRNLNVPISSLSDAAVQFFLNANYQEYRFDEKLEDLGKLHVIINIMQSLLHIIFNRESCSEALVHSKDG